MGNMVTFAVREDYLDALAGLDWDSLSNSVNYYPAEPRFFQGHVGDKARRPGANLLDGITVSSYHHTGDGAVLYVSSQLMYLPALFFAADVEDKDADFFAREAKKSSKYMLGRNHKFSVTKLKNNVSVMPPKDSAKVFVFGYLTDVCEDISRQADVFPQLLAAIKQGDLSQLTRHIEHIATIDPGQAVMIKMCQLPTTKRFAL